MDVSLGRVIETVIIGLKLFLHSSVSFRHYTPEDTPKKVLIVFRKYVVSVRCSKRDIKKPSSKIVSVSKHELPQSGEVVEKQGTCYP